MNFSDATLLLWKHLSAQRYVPARHICYCCFMSPLFAVNSEFPPSPEQQVGCTCCQEITESGSSETHWRSKGGYEISICFSNLLSTTYCIAGGFISCGPLGFIILTFHILNGNGQITVVTRMDYLLGVFPEVRSSRQTAAGRYWTGKVCFRYAAPSSGKHLHASVKFGWFSLIDGRIHLSLKYILILVWHVESD